MRKELVIGILRETKPGESRAPLTPSDVEWLGRRGIRTELESSRQRAFRDGEYKRCTAKVVDNFGHASLLVGIKEPEVANLHPGKLYMLFSHTIKGQAGNMPLLKEFIKKGITLIDYERITDPYGERLVYFGRFAGICGAIDSLYYLGRKLRWKGMKSPFDAIRPAHLYTSYREARSDVARLADKIRAGAIDRRLAPFIIAITGHGNVKAGVEEVLGLLRPIEIHPRDMSRFARHQKGVKNRVYKIVLHREEKFRSKNGGGFYYEDYLKDPKKFESNLDRYLPHINMLIHTSYWDERYPRLVTKRMVRRLRRGRLRLEFIGDLSCDINGSIEFTRRATTVEDPVFTYDPKANTYSGTYESEGIAVLARDNLPTELPKDASRDFGGLAREYIYQIAAHGVTDITNHVAIPKELRQAVITQNGRLAAPYRYLKKYLT